MPNGARRTASSAVSIGAFGAGTDAFSYSLLPLVHGYPTVPAPTRKSDRNRGNRSVFMTGLLPSHWRNFPAASKPSMCNHEESSVS